MRCVNIPAYSPLALIGQIARALMAATLLCCVTLPLRADITIKFDDLKDGDKISDIAAIVVRADSGDGVDKVEFAVDDQLRFSTGSSPYTFKWDTIADTEGAHSLAVTATDANGVKKTVKLALTVDNQLDLGASALAQKARDAIVAKDMESAAKYSRRALKAEPDNIDASRAYAAIMADRLIWDKAIGTLEKAKNLSGNPAAMLELASYRMHHAVLPENSASLVADMESAGQLRRKAADAAIEALKAKNLPADQNSTHETLGDAYLDAGRYSEAVLEYGKAASGGAITSTNRLALAYVLNDQPQEAVVLLRSIIKDKSGDPATRAVMGLALLRLRKFADAREMVRGDSAGRSVASRVVAAYADAALGNLPAATQAAREAVESRPYAGEAHYALSMGIARLTESEPEVVRALALSPFQSGPMIDYAVRYAVLTEHPDRFETALKLLQIVLKSEPENGAAKLAKVLLLLHLKRVKDAEPTLAELSRREAQSADVQVAAAIYFDITGKPTAVEERLRQARKLDPTFFELGAVPKPLEFLYQNVRKIHYRGGFYLSPGTLYAAKAAPETP